VGETEMVAAQQAQNAPPIQARAAIKPTTGMHDVYFVFRSDPAKPQGMPFILMTATFVSGSSTPAGYAGGDGRALSRTAADDAVNRRLTLVS
jgi:hypothetical protein